MHFHHSIGSNKSHCCQPLVGWRCLRVCMHLTLYCSSFSISTCNTPDTFKAIHRIHWTRETYPRKVMSTSRWRSVRRNETSGSWCLRSIARLVFRCRMELDNVLPCSKFAFSIGHFLNDLCASVWFSYSLVFYHRIAKFSNSTSGYLLLIGQVADAISTTCVGFASDRTALGPCGKRKSWHLLGTLLERDFFLSRDIQYHQEWYVYSCHSHFVFNYKISISWLCSHRLFTIRSLSSSSNLAGHAHKSDIYQCSTN